MNIFSKIHGTTADRFRIGSNIQTITLTGLTTSNETVALTNVENTAFSTSSTLFFTVYIIGKGISNLAAYEINGCYVNDTNTVTGSVLTTYADTGVTNDPSVSFDINNVLTVNCTGAIDDPMQWTAKIEFIII